MGIFGGDEMFCTWLWWWLILIYILWTLQTLHLNWVHFIVHKWHIKFTAERVRYHFTLTVSNVSEYVQHPKPSYIVNGSIKLYNHFEKLAVSYKDKHIPILWPSSSTARYLTQEKWKCMFSKRLIYECS